MLDWKSGDNLIAVKTGSFTGELPCDLYDLTIGREYEIAQLELAAWPDCPDCDSTVVVCLIEPHSERWGYCTCVFRKPIDFKLFCNITTQAPVKELTDA